MQLLPYPTEFYEKETTIVARNLLGSYLVRNTAQARMVGRIVEVEAYLGKSDHACHAAAGITNRTKIFWGKPGVAYVFLIYGVYYCFNAITLPEGKAGCVLIRAIEPLVGMERMIDNRRGKDGIFLSNGPGKLCQALEIDLSLNGIDLTCSNSPLYIAKGNAQGANIEVTKRIGITKAPDQPLRYVLKTNTSKSRA